MKHRGMAELPSYELKDLNFLLLLNTGASVPGLQDNRVSLIAHWVYMGWSYNWMSMWVYRVQGVLCPWVKLIWIFTITVRRGAIAISSWMHTKMWY